MSLHYVEVQNLRGYSDALLPLHSRNTILVGKNNSGKTSVLRLLNWFLNEFSIDTDALTKTLISSDCDFLLPARDKKHKARRIAVGIRVEDARRHTRFKCIDGIAYLRLDIKLTPTPVGILKLGYPKKKDNHESDDEAKSLLAELRSQIKYLYVPSFRDVASKRFETTISREVRGKLSEGALHSQQGGAPTEYRSVKKVINALSKISTELVTPLLDNIKSQLPFGFAESANIELVCTPEDMVNWMTERIALRVSTGEHDNRKVDIMNLGSGLQSLLDLAIHRSIANSKNDCKVTLAIEEPEAFLHPSAQRVVARMLMDSSLAASTIITTHSSTLVEEANYGDVVIVQGHKIYAPQNDQDEQRSEINTTLLTGYGSELVFSRGVLLVEGPGDQLYFESIRRRIAKLDKTGKIDDLLVIPVGSKTFFSPWIKFINSYGSSDDRPIKWLIATDGDAVTEIRQASKEVNLGIETEVNQSLHQISRSTDTTGKIRTIIQFNTCASRCRFPVSFLPIDLEFAICEAMSNKTCLQIADKAGWSLSAGNEMKDLLKKLGSKATTNPSTKGKWPWLRGYIGNVIPWSEVSPSMKSLIQRWLELVMTSDEANKLLSLDI